MSVDLIPILIDEKVLADEIMRLRKALPPEKLDNPNGEICFHDALIFENPSSPNNQYAYAELEPYKNTRWSHRANSIRFQLLFNAKESGVSQEAARSADCLFQFIGGFICHLTTVVPFNEFGLTSSVIISAASARRLHLFFQQIIFESLRPLYNEHCKADEAESRGYIKSLKN